MNTVSKFLIRLRSIRRYVYPQKYKEYYIQKELNCLGCNTYLELGVRLGTCFRYIQARAKVGVDPCRTKPISKLRVGESFYEMTSDVFFHEVATTAFSTEKVDVCLVDGWHTFEQSLADTLNAAKFLHRDGTIVLDDVYPDTEDKAALTPHGRAWTGDVWKTMALLRSTQPEWEIFSVAVDEGVGIVKPHGHPANLITVDDIRRCKELPYGALRSNPDLIGLVTESS